MKIKSSSLKNIHICSEELLVTPRELQKEIPQTPRTMQTVSEGRDTIEQILDGDDTRLLAIVGPCSIHNLDDALEYAKRLKALADEISDTTFVVMRTYFEKPRSSIGWKGLIDDPFMDGSFRIGEGLRMARRFLRDVAELGLPAGTELLDTLVPQFIGDFITFSGSQKTAFQPCSAPPETRTHTLYCVAGRLPTMTRRLSRPVSLNSASTACQNQYSSIAATQTRTRILRCNQQFLTLC